MWLDDYVVSDFIQGTPAEYCLNLGHTPVILEIFRGNGSKGEFSRRVTTSDFLYSILLPRTYCTGNQKMCIQY